MPKLSFERLVFFEVVAIVYILRKCFLLFFNSKELRNLEGSYLVHMAIEEKTPGPKDTSAPFARKLSPV